jgi:MinD-like ATPase involved in chromosome partitioning or flagellar assembly
MNAYQGKKVLRTSDIEASIRFPIKATICEDFALVPTSINKGTPFVASHRKSPITKDIVALAKQLAETGSISQKSQPSPGKPARVEQELSGPSKPTGRRFALWQTLTSAMRITSH